MYTYDKQCFLHKMFLTGPLKYNFLMGKTSYRQNVKITFDFGSPFFYDPKKLRYLRIFNLQTSQMYTIQAVGICSYVSAKEKFIKHQS